MGFDGGLTVKASSSPHVVPLPYSVEDNIDPEEAFVASLSSCHMLFFLSIAAKRKFIIDSYLDNAVGIMEKDDDGKISMTKVTLKPIVEFSGDRKPTLEQLKKSAPSVSWTVFHCKFSKNQSCHRNQRLTKKSRWRLRRTWFGRYTHL